MMKKLLSLVLALMLAMFAVSAFAEETEADVKDFAEKDGSEGEGKHESRT